MKKLGYALLLVLPVLAASVPQRAAADEQWKQSRTAWKAMNNCAQAAIKAYPDYTPEALAKREAHRRLCLRSANLPGGDDAPPPRR